MTDPGPLAPRLPAAFWEVPYVAARFPGSPAVARRPGLAAGANCQLFAYEVLALFGAGRLPDLRSDELWADTAATHRVTDVRPLDLLLFNGTDGLRRPCRRLVGVKRAGRGDGPAAPPGAR